tara:strand:+ start:360 stop:761 length:402 start_codon:yes stop_codon:yes gene_type:complete
MENLEEKDNLIISKDVHESLEGMVFWSKLLAIVGLIGTGFIGIAIIIRLFSSNTLTVAPTLYYIFIGTLYFLPILFLYQFSIRTKSALNTNSQNDLNEGMKNLATTFKLVGIYSIGIILLYIALILFIFSDYR